jgi:hypothetical protein
MGYNDVSSGVLIPNISEVHIAPSWSSRPRRRHYNPLKMLVIDISSIRNPLPKNTASHHKILVFSQSLPTIYYYSKPVSTSNMHLFTNK